MNDFDYDVMQKKRTGTGDRHRKRGSRSRKCALPCDYMTDAQVRGMSGPVKTYQLDQPMGWYGFKEMPEDLQKQYLEHLRETYTATCDMIADMFHVSNGSVSARAKMLGVTMTRTHLTKDEKLERTKNWTAFLYGEDEADRTEAADVQAPAEAMPPRGLMKPADGAVTPLTIGKIGAEFNGAFDPASLASWLAAFPVHVRQEVRVRVEVELL